MSFDLSFFESLYGLAGKSPLLDFAGIFLAQFLAYLLILLFIFYLFLERNWKIRFYKFALITLAVILSRGIIAEAFKFFYVRPRPPAALGIVPLIVAPESASLPSGHAAVFFAFAAALFFLNRKWSAWFFAGAIMMGAARVFVGVHFPSDILAGAVVGMIGAVIAEKIVPKPFPKPQ